MRDGTAIEFQSVSHVSDTDITIIQTALNISTTATIKKTILMYLCATNISRVEFFVIISSVYIHPSIYPSIQEHPPTHPCVHPSIHPSIHRYLPPSICLYLFIYVYRSLCLSINPSLLIFVFLFPSLHSFFLLSQTHTPVCPFICISVSSFPFISLFLNMFRPIKQTYNTSMMLHALVSTLIG